MVLQKRSLACQSRARKHPGCVLHVYFGTAQSDLSDPRMSAVCKSSLGPYFSQMPWASWACAKGGFPPF